MTCKSIPIPQRNFVLSQSLLNFLFVMYKYHWVRRHWSRHYHHFPLLSTCHPYKGISSTTHHQHHLIHFINHSMTLFFIASKGWFLSPNFTFHAIPTILIIWSFLYRNKNNNYHLHFCFNLPKTLFNTLLYLSHFNIILCLYTCVVIIIQVYRKIRGILGLQNQATSWFLRTRIATVCKCSALLKSHSSGAGVGVMAMPDSYVPAWLDRDLWSRGVLESKIRRRAHKPSSPLSPPR